MRTQGFKYSRTERDVWISSYMHSAKDSGLIEPLTIFKLNNRQ